MLYFVVCPFYSKSKQILLGKIAKSVLFTLIKINTGIDDFKKIF